MVVRRWRNQADGGEETAESTRRRRNREGQHQNR
jgi:hypothetical protein